MWNFSSFFRRYFGKKLTFLESNHFSSQKLLSLIPYVLNRKIYGPFLKFIPSPRGWKAFVLNSQNLSFWQSSHEKGGGRSNPHLPNSEHFWALCVPERRVMKNKIPKKLYFSEAIVPFILDIHRQNLDIQNLGHSEIQKF